MKTLFIALTTIISLISSASIAVSEPPPRIPREDPDCHRSARADSLSVFVVEPLVQLQKMLLEHGRGHSFCRSDLSDLSKFKFDVFFNPKLCSEFKPESCRRVSNVILVGDMVRQEAKRWSPPFWGNDINIGNL